MAECTHVQPQLAGQFSTTPFPRLGVSLVCDRIREFGTWVRATENAGFSAIRVGDSPAMYPETFVQATIVALESRRVMFGPRVTNPITRHPSVIASGMVAVAQLSGGRAVVGIGLGDSAVHSIGERPATLVELRAYVDALRSLFATSRATYLGKHLECPYGASGGMIPIYLAASGSRGLALAGEIADGVIVGGGLTRETVALALGYIEDGARRVGRHLEDLDIWWLTGASIADTDAAARRAIRTHLASHASACFRGGTDGKAIPSEMVRPIQLLMERYEYREHEAAGESHNAKLIDELELTEFFTERFAIVGTPAHFANQILRAASWGANQIWFTMPLPDKLQYRSVRDLGIRGS